MGVNLPVNITKKNNKKLRYGPALTVDTLDLLARVKLSKRICLGIINGFLDFIGIAYPFTVRFKELFKLAASAFQGQQDHLMLLGTLW